MQREAMNKEIRVPSGIQYCAVAACAPRRERGTIRSVAEQLLYYLQLPDLPVLLNGSLGALLA